jgi:hypothetical protein
LPRHRSHGVAQVLQESLQTSLGLDDQGAIKVAPSACPGDELMPFPGGHLRGPAQVPRPARLGDRTPT